MMAGKSIPARISDLKTADVNQVAIGGHITNRDVPSIPQSLNTSCEFTSRQKRDEGIKWTRVRLTIRELIEKVQVGRKHGSHSNRARENDQQAGLIDVREGHD